MSSLIKKNFNLKALNWLKVGGAAEYYSCPQSIKELKEAVLWAQEESIEIKILGEGSNVLIHDSGVSGLVLASQGFKKVHSVTENNENNRLEVLAESGVSKSKIMRSFFKHKLAPALFLSGLPGNLGGGVFMNAGVSEDRTPKEFCEIVDWFEILEFKSLKVKRYLNKDIHWVYRKTSGYENGFITVAQVSWPMEPDLEIPKKVMAANELRLSKQPLELPSCGSVFKNPEGTSAGKLIDECGLKGFTIGGAQISKKHANFIVNIDNANAADVYGLIQKAKAEVLSQKGIQLITEVQLFGNWE